MLVCTASPCYSGTWYILSLDLAMSRRKLAVCLQVRGSSLSGAERHAGRVAQRSFSLLSSWLCPQAGYTTLLALHLRFLVWKTRMIMTPSTSQVVTRTK